MPRRLSWEASDYLGDWVEIIDTEPSFPIMRSLFQEIQRGLQETDPDLPQGLRPDFLWREARSGGARRGLEEILYEADFGVETAEEISSRRSQAAYKADKSIRGEDAARIGATVLARVLEGAEGAVELGRHQPEVICLVGVNGSGKTTTSPKLGPPLPKRGPRRLAGRLRHLPRRRQRTDQGVVRGLGIELVASQHGADSAAVAFDAYAAAKSRWARPRDPRYGRPPPHQEQPDEGSSKS